MGLNFANRRPESEAVIRYNGSSVEPGLSTEELIRRRRRENALNAAEPLAPDLADAAAKVAGSASAGAARRGSGRSAMASVFDPTAPLGRSTLLGGG